MIISFDMDGTIADMNFDHLLWFKEIPQLYSEKNKVSFEKARKICTEEYTKVGDEDLRWYNVKYWLGHFELKKEFHHLMADLKQHIRLYPEAKEVIKELSEKHKLIVISNAPKDFLNMKIEVGSIKDHFDKIFSTTTDFKRVKKEGDIYKKICEILKIKPEEMIHIGDHYTFDYQVPKKIGIKAYYLDRKGEKKGKYIVKDLKEFQEKIS